MYTHFLHRIHSPIQFLPPSHPLTGAKPPPEQDLFLTPVLWFGKGEKIKRKTCHFWLFEIKVATQGVSLWYFHVYMYCTPNWLMSSNYLHSTFVPFLWWFQLV
jgi:hypothetical protein